MRVAIGRFIAGIISKWLKVQKIIIVGISIVIIGCVFLFAAGGTILIVLGLMLIGIGNGPLFPNFHYMTPILFGEEKSPAMMGAQMAISSISTMTFPIIVGQVASKMGFEIFPYMITILIVLLAIAYLFLYRRIAD